VFPTEFEYDGNVHCEYCGEMTHHSRCRVLSKTSGKFQCSNCCTKCTQLRRSFGQWPTSQFSNLSKDNVIRVVVQTQCIGTVRCLSTSLPLGLCAYE